MHGMYIRTRGFTVCARQLLLKVCDPTQSLTQSMTFSITCAVHIEIMGADGCPVVVAQIHCGCQPLHYPLCLPHLYLSSVRQEDLGVEC